MDVTNKTFVVTGGGNGIGREVVLGLLKRGARVAAVDLKPDALAETTALAGPGARLTTHEVNVADAARVAALPEEVIAAHGTVDGVLNVAGIIQPFVKLVDLERSAVERVMDVNFWGVVNMCQAFLPHLLARPAASVVNVSSMGALVPVPGQTIYGASKAAVKLLTEGLRAETRGTSVVATVVFPGAIGTNITAHSGVDVPGRPNADSIEAKHRTTSPADAAEQIIRGMEKGAYHVMVGADVAFLAKFVRIAPQRAMEFLAQKMADLLKG